MVVPASRQEQNPAYRRTHDQERPGSAGPLAVLLSHPASAVQRQEAITSIHASQSDRVRIVVFDGKLPHDVGRIGSSHLDEPRRLGTRRPESGWSCPSDREGSLGTQHEGRDNNCDEEHCCPSEIDLSCTRARDREQPLSPMLSERSGAA